MAQKPKRSGTTRSEHVVLPTVETLLSIPTTPKAVCSLHHPDADGPPTQLDADDSGIVRLHARASHKAKPIELHLEWTDESGTKSTHVMAIRADTNAPPPPTPAQAIASRRLIGKAHPGLQGEALMLPNQELFRRGYPPRPDHSVAPSRYALLAQASLATIRHGRTEESRAPGRVLRSQAGDGATARRQASRQPDAPLAAAGGPSHV